MIEVQSISPSYRQSDFRSNDICIDDPAIVADMRSEFGKRLLKARTQAGLKQADVAKAAGMAQSTYTKLENVGQGSSYTAVIAQACGVNAVWLATGKGEMIGASTAPAKPIDAQAADYDALAQRREFMLLDIADMLTQYKNAADLRIAYARVLACLDQFTAERTIVPPQAPEATEPPAATSHEPMPKPAKHR